jgi:hypothetical protein
MRSGGKDNVERFGRCGRRDGTKATVDLGQRRLCSNIADRQPGADHASLRMSHARIGAPQTCDPLPDNEERVCAMEALDE